MSRDPFFPGDRALARRGSAAPGTVLTECLSWVGEWVLGAPQGSEQRAVFTHTGFPGPSLGLTQILAFVIVCHADSINAATRPTDNRGLSLFFVANVLPLESQEREQGSSPRPQAKGRGF